MSSLPTEVLEIVARGLDATDAARASASSSWMNASFGPECARKMDEKIVFWRDEFENLKSAFAAANGEIYELGQEYYELRPDADYLGAGHEGDMLERIDANVGKFSSLEWEFGYEDDLEYPEVGVEDFEFACTPLSMATTVDGRVVRFVIFASTEGLCPTHELTFDGKDVYGGCVPDSADMFAFLDVFGDGDIMFSE